MEDPVTRAAKAWLDPKEALRDLEFMRPVVV